MPWFDPARPPSGAIPRVPVWEITTLVFVALYGVVGFLSSDGRITQAVLGNWSNVWSVVLAACGVAGLVSLLIPAPRGLMLNLAAMLVLTTASWSVLVATDVYQHAFFYRGATSLMVFSVGSTWRAGQILHQLQRIRHRLALLALQAEAEVG